MFESKTKDKGHPVRRLEGTDVAVEVTLLMVKRNTGWRCVFIAMPRPLYFLERGPVPIVQEACLDIGLVRVGVVKRKSLAATGVPTPKRPAESLY